MRLNSFISILQLFQSLKQLQYIVEAYPTAAGHCSSGDLSDKFSPHGDTGRGPLSNGSLRVKFGSSVLQNASTNALNANQQYTATVDFTETNSSFFFRGLLFRLSGINGEDVEGTLSIGSDNNVQIKSGCADGISAVTHTNSNDKTRVSFNFEYTKSANADVLLEVTVMRQADQWYYSSYNLQIGNENQNIPTSSPTENQNPPISSPTENQNIPTSSPTENQNPPTSSPTENQNIPTSSPTENQNIPTSSPTENQNIPTSSPVVSQSSCYKTSINTFILFISIITLVNHLRGPF